MPNVLSRAKTKHLPSTGEGRESIATCLITVSLATLICHQDVTNVVPKYVIPIVWESINSFRAYLDTTNGAAT